MNDPLIDRFINRLRKRKGENHGTYKQYKSELTKFDEWLQDDERNAEDMQPLDIEDYILSLKEQGYAESSIRGHFRTLRSFYTTSKEKFQVIDQSPCDSVTLSELDISSKRDDDTVRYITQDEKNKMIDSLPERHFVSNKLIIELLWQTGMRVSALLGIEVDNVDQENNRIKIYREKIDEWGYVHYQESLNRLLDIWLETERPLRAESDYLFPGKSSEKISHDIVRNIILDASSEFNEVVRITKNGNRRMKITPHTLRHSHAVHALKSGVNIRSVQKQLGHANIDRTMAYMQIIEDDVSEAYQEFE